MSRTIYLITIAILLVSLAVPSLAAGQAAEAGAAPATSAIASLPSQAGLPPELTIASTPPLEQQLRTLEGLRDFNPPGGTQSSGPLGFLRGLIGGSGNKPLVIQPAAVVSGAETLRGRLVAVSGVYRQLTPETGKFDFDGGTLRISMPSGVPMQGLGTAGPNGLPITVEGIVETSGALPQVRATQVRPAGSLTVLRLARVQELLDQPQEAEKSFELAATRAQVEKSPFAAYAKTSAARQAYELRDSKKARNLYAMAWNPFTGHTKQGEPLFWTWVPREDGSGWEKLGVAEAISKPLDTLNRTDFWYKFMEFFVYLAGGIRWLGIVFLAIISRLLIWPLTKKQLASAEAMKRLQPQIKALQDRYTDDKQKFQEEFWRLCQANGVNPLGGCLPMLVQMPVLILLWRGIRDYIVQFNGHSFLWVHNLAAPDTGLLVAYTISMIFFQKMTQKLQPAPTMNPQQAQQQQMMTYMMPLMFFFFFQSFPAAFLLYWLATNIVYFAQQYTYTKAMERRAKSEGGVESLIPGPAKPSGFVGAMTKMMSLKAEQQEPEAESEVKSFHEKQAEAKGKKTGKADEAAGKRRRK